MAKIARSEIEIEEDNTGIIEALDGIVSITAETQASKEDYITVMYPENTISIEIKIFSDTNDIEHLEIINNKVIPPVENIEDVNLLLYFTDGFGKFPIEEGNFDTVWVLTKDDIDIPFGRSIYL